MTIIGTLPFQLQNGTTADATQVMANYNAVVTDVNANAAGNGVNTDITALTALITPITPAQGGTPVYFASTAGGTANAITVASPTPTGFSLSFGKRITFVAVNTNTGATTMDVNSTGATAVRKNGHAGLEALTGGEIVAGDTIEAIFDGTYFVLLSTPFSDFGTLTNIASATTTDIGVIGTHNVNITGTTTITGFGSSASVNEPVYLIRFNAALTLTYNGTSLILPGAANIVTAAGDWAIAQYSGSGNWVVTSYSRAAGTAVVNPTPVGSAQGLTLVNNNGTPDTSIDISANQVVMINPTGNVPIYATGVSLTCNTTTGGSGTSTANGMDGVARTSNTWYYFYLISNGSATASLCSTSATSPAMPSGYTYKFLVGAARTDGSGNFYFILQKGNLTQYVIGGGGSAGPTIMRNLANGIAGTYSASSPTLTTVSITGTVPPISSSILVVGTTSYGGGAIGAFIVAPTTNYGGSNRGPAGSGGQVYPLWNNAGGGATSMQAEIVLESPTSIAWASQAAGGGISCLGWRSNVNAS